MKNILVPIDGSHPSLLAIRQTEIIARAFDSRVTLLNVYESATVPYMPNPYVFPADSRVLAQELKQHQDTSKRILEQAAALLSGVPGGVETVSKAGNPAETIIEFVEAGDFDLVIMGSGGMKGLKHLIIGSVTRKVAISIGVPILIVK